MLLDLNDKSITKLGSVEEIQSHFINSMKDEEVCLEFGVFEGKSINRMARIKPNGTFVGFDSFLGLPEFWVGDFVKGTFATEFDKLKFEPNVSIVKGWFDETLELFIENNDLSKLKFVHIDCDLYSSTKYVLDKLNDVIIRNECYILFDEFYNYEGSENDEFAAFLEWVNNNNVSYTVLSKNIHHQQVLIKINGKI